MAGIQDCINEIIKASNGAYTPEQAQKIIEGVVKKRDAGVSEMELFEELLKISDPKEKESAKLIRKYNEVRTKALRKESVNRITARLKESGLDTLLGKTMRALGWDSPKAKVREGMLNFVRSIESYSQVIHNTYEQSVDAAIKGNNLVDFVQDIKNDNKIIQEMAHLNEGGTQSITGNDKAFQSAKIFRDHLKDLFDRKIANGSSIAFKKGFITSNLWSESKVAALSDDEFVRLLSETEDVQRRGLSRNEILDLKRKVGSRNYIDPESLDETLPSDLMGRTGSNLAELSGTPRSINLTTDEYIKLAPIMFEGEQLLDRIFLQLRRDASTVSKLEMLGANPKNQLKRIMETIVAETQDLEGISKNGQHALQNKFFLGTKTEDGVLVKALFGELENPSNPDLAAISEVFRDIKAFTSLSGASITAQADVINAALRAKMLAGDGNGLEIPQNILKLYNRQVQQFGKQAADAQLKAEIAGMGTIFDGLKVGGRFDDPNTVSQVQGALRKVKKIARTGSKLNQLENMTNLSLRANYNMVSSITHSFKDSAFDSLSDELKILFRDSGIKSEEWDFIRKYAATRDKFGNELLTTERINSLDLETFKELYPDLKSNAALKRQQQLLASKWNSTLWREARTGVIMPDVIDRARVSLGTQRGTVIGEFVRQGMLFKSFSFGFTARIMAPLLKRGKLTTVGETAAGLLFMGMGINWAKDILGGKTPRDFRNPENAIGLVGFAAGLPYLDAMTYALTSDNPNDSNFADVFVGPVGADFFETVARGFEVGKDVLKGKDPEIVKELSRTFIPLSPTRNAPVLSIGHNLLYNELMDYLSPGHKARARRRLSDRGQESLI